jgi:hypothetical protein
MRLDISSSDSREKMYDHVFVNRLPFHSAVDFLPCLSTLSMARVLSCLTKGLRYHVYTTCPSSRRFFLPLLHSLVGRAYHARHRVPWRCVHKMCGRAAKLK